MDECEELVTLRRSRALMGQLHPENEDYRWLHDALGGDGRGQPRRALARPSAAAPELLLPLDSAAAGATALRRYHDGRTSTERAKTVAAIALARIGLLRFAPGERVEIDSFALLDRLSEALGESDLHVAITLGPRRRNRKPVLQLMRSDGHTLGFAKVGWSPFTRDLVSNEAEWLDRLAGSLPDDIRVPEVLARVECHERTIIVTTGLATSLRAGLSGGLSSDTIVRLAQTLGTERRPFAELRHLDDLRRGRVGEVIDVDRMIEHHGDTVLTLGVWHGDLTPWNTSTVKGISQIWDWEFADDGRPVGFDLLHTTFESARRRRGQTEARALTTMQSRAGAILAAIDQPTDAVVDLYLCELITREARLAGEGWDPSDLGPLESHATDMLRRRLA